MAKGIRYNYNEYHKINDMGILEKKCTLHNNWFPEESPWMPCTSEYFHVNEKNSKDGLHPYCKKCGSKKARKIALENPERTKDNVERWQEENIIRYRQVRKKYNEDNKDKIYNDTIKWVNENRIRARELSKQHRKHDITDSEWKANKDFFKNDKGEWCCAYCGKLISDNWKMRSGKIMFFDFDKEHVDDNGYNDIRNCVPSCTSCNSSKSTKTLEEFLEFNLIKQFTQDKYIKIKQWITEEYKKYIESKPPYRITRKQNEGLKTFHWELWSVNEKRDFVECLAVSDKKAGLNQYIKLYFNIAN